MSNNVAIWGTGKIGYIAFFYYKDNSNIVYYIDNDERKWGKMLNGIKICSPDILRRQDIRIILAMKRGIDDVRKQLYTEYGLKDFILFQINQEFYFSENKNYDIQEDICIVSFEGGLGNQMFQYAFLKNLQYHGKKVLACLTSNISTTSFYLLDVFRNINLEICTEEQKIDLIKKNINDKEKSKKFILYIEESINETESKKMDLSIINVTGGVFSGLFQTYKFAEQVRDLLIKDFVFKDKIENKLEKFRDCLDRDITVSIHIRRGDYLTGNNYWIYGDICTQEYYINAISYMKDKVGNCKFVFFSNDIEWVKRNYNIEHAIYVSSTLFDNYQDWYDMYLMSICKHNIIANSTFSWWGAWLNSNKGKIVIAPSKWVNLCDYKDIYPDDWIKI
jgi:hypothetical protein